MWQKSGIIRVWKILWIFIFVWKNFYIFCLSKFYLLQIFISSSSSSSNNSIIIIILTEKQEKTY